jgi:hypothetical protein
MQFPREQILELIRSRGDQDKAGQAEAELPEQVDTERGRGLLDRFGIDPQQLLGGLATSSACETPRVTGRGAIRRILSRHARPQPSSRPDPEGRP